MIHGSRAILSVHLRPSTRLQEIDLDEATGGADLSDITSLGTAELGNGTAELSNLSISNLGTDELGDGTRASNAAEESTKETKSESEASLGEVAEHGEQVQMDQASSTDDELLQMFSSLSIHPQPRSAMASKVLQVMMMMRRFRRMFPFCRRRRRAAIRPTHSRQSMKEAVATRSRVPRRLCRMRRRRWRRSRRRRASSSTSASRTTPRMLAQTRRETATWRKRSMRGRRKAVVRQKPRMRRSMRVTWSVDAIMEMSGAMDRFQSVDVTQDSEETNQLGEMTATDETSTATGLNSTDASIDEESIPGQ